MSLVIDAHHHLLDPGQFFYPWLTQELSGIDRPFRPEDLAPELAAAGVDRTIVIQTHASIEETRWFLWTAAASPSIAGVVGWIDLTEAGAPDALDGLRSAPGGHRLVGIRHQVHDEADPDWLRRADVGRGLAAVDAAALTYDLLVRERELPAALDVVRSRPGLRFVIDHLAKPPVRSGDLTSWATRLRPFGTLDNVWCKLSGLVTEADWSSWRVADLAPAVEIALETFGPARLLFGSDWPVCLVAASYGEVVETARVLTAGLSGSDRESVFGGAAMRAYPGSVAPDRVG